MTATIETLHKDGNEIYPTTVADAVVDEDNHTVQQRIDSGVFLKDGGTASELQPYITSNLVVNGAITPAKLDRSYLPLAGGNMTGRINSSKTGSWFLGRDNATVFNSSSIGTDSFNPVASFKTKNGDWSIGGIENDNNDQFYLNFCPDTSYESHSQTGQVHLKITKDGIPTETIKNKAITKAKIDFSSLKPVWDMTCTTNTSSSDVTWTKTTLLGNSITVHQCNGGTGMMIDSGASSYRIAKHYVSFDSNSFTATAIGVHNVAVGSTIWGRFTGITNDVQKNFQQVRWTAESGVNYGTAVKLNATTVSSGAIEYTVSRVKGATFVIIGTLHLGGNNTSVVFTIECDAKDNNSFPTIYLRGTGSSITNVIHTMEILET